MARSDTGNLMCPVVAFSRTYHTIVVSVSGQNVSNFRRFCQSRSVLNSVMAEPVSFGEYSHENPRWTG